MELSAEKCHAAWRWAVIHKKECVCVCMFVWGIPTHGGTKCTVLYVCVCMCLNTVCVCVLVHF